MIFSLTVTGSDPCHFFRLYWFCLIYPVHHLLFYSSLVPFFLPGVQLLEFCKHQKAVHTWRTCQEATKSMQFSKGSIDCT